MRPHTPITMHVLVAALLVAGVAPVAANPVTDDGTTLDAPTGNALDPSRTDPPLLPHFSSDSKMATNLSCGGGRCVVGPFTYGDNVTTVIVPAYEGEVVVDVMHKVLDPRTRKVKDVHERWFGCTLPATSLASCKAIGTASISYSEFWIVTAPNGPLVGDYGVWVQVSR